MLIVFDEIQHVLSHTVFKCSFVVNFQLGIPTTEELRPFVFYFEWVEAFINLFLRNGSQIFYELTCLEAFADFSTVLEYSIIYFSSIMRRFRNITNQERNLIKMTKLHQLHLKILTIDICLLVYFFTGYLINRVLRCLIALVFRLWSSSSFVFFESSGGSTTTTATGSLPVRWWCSVYCSYSSTSGFW